MSYAINLPADEGTKYTVIRYPAGELQIRFEKDRLKELQAEFHDITVTAKIESSEHVLQLTLLTDALWHVVARMGGTGPGVHVSLVLPYLPYSRADRRFVEGDCYGLKVFGDIVNSLCYDKVFTLDVHSSKSNRFIANLHSISAETILNQVFGAMKYYGIEKPVILVPDKGAKLRYDFDSMPGQKVYTCDKVRDAKSGILSGFEVPKIKENTAIIIDDICDGGGTFLGLADECFKVNPHLVGNLYLYVTHGIFSKGLDELSKRFKFIFTTDSMKRNAGFNGKVFTISTQELILQVTSEEMKHATKQC